ncbi:MAG: hypothetical protein CVV42_04870 [Candidatus Riflebacteria bacterium HGW-Riflebacteria-2]|jgi:hypothetical protein|nr:MAG: hypothetical protein CVV42_04870 [Candidatus Riflebacteria bacterium HGW-Riflebacteria-2]
MPVISQYRPKFACFFFPLSFTAFLTAIIAVVWLVIGGGLNAIIMLSGTVSVMLTVAWAGLSLNTSYEFDAENAQVVHSISLGRHQRKAPVCRFDEVGAFTVKGIHNRARVQTWWEYQVVMLLKSGRLLEISEPSPKSVFESNRLAEKLAKLVDCDYFPGEQQKTVEVALAGEHPVFEYRSWSWGDVISEFGLATVASLIFFAAIVAFIVALVVILS